MTEYHDDIEKITALKQRVGSSWNAISPEMVARMRAQNRFKTGLKIAQYTADIMRHDMGEYDANSSASTPVRYAFLELGIDNGIIVSRTDSLGAGLPQKKARRDYRAWRRSLGL